MKAPEVTIDMSGITFDPADVVRREAVGTTMPDDGGPAIVETKQIAAGDTTVAFVTRYDSDFSVDVKFYDAAGNATTVNGFIEIEDTVPPAVSGVLNLSFKEVEV